MLSPTELRSVEGTLVRLCAECVDRFVENVVACATGSASTPCGGCEGWSSSVATDVRSLISLSKASDPTGNAIPAPGVLIGNSSSSGNGMGCEIVLPLIDPPVFVLAGFSARHLAAGPLVFIVMNDLFQASETVIEAVYCCNTEIDSTEECICCLAPSGHSSIN